MQAVNLLPLEARPAGRWSAIGTGLTPNRVIPIGGVVAAVIALLIAGLYVHERSVVNGKKNTLADREARLVAVEAQAQPVKDAQAQAVALTSAVDGIVGARMIWDTTLGDLARVLPPGVFLTSLSASAPVPAAAVTAPVVATDPSSTSATTTTATTAVAPPVAPVAPTTTFTIVGTAPSHNVVALVLDRLALLPWLSNTGLVSTTRTTTGSAQFSVSAVVLNNGGH
jgi:Tfp pilus assembly protein PilN